MKITIGLVGHSEGNGESLYINDHRVCGGKPWGGGTVVKSWEVSLEDLATAIPAMKIKERVSPEIKTGKAISDGGR